MQRSESTDWRRHLDRIGEVSPALAVKIVGQACEALRQPHKLGRAREYIGPGHLVLETSGSGSLRVRLLEPDTPIDLDSDDRELERTSYLSPERAQALKSIDHRSDIWSLGVLLFESMTGRSPWGRAESPSDVIVTMCTRPAPLVQDFAPWVPPDIADIVHTCLQREPSARFQTASELLEAIRAIPLDLTIQPKDVVGLSEEERAQVADKNEVPPSRAPVELYEEGRLSLPRDPTVPVIARPKKASSKVIAWFVIVALSVTALLAWQIAGLIWS